MSGRTAARALVAVLVVIALAGLGVGIYQAGVSQGVADAGRVPVGAVVPYAGSVWHGFGWGFGWGFGLFGLIFPILFFVLLFALVRAALWGGRGHGWGGPGRHGPGGYGPGGYGPGGYGPGGSGSGADRGGWQAERERQLADLHRRLHDAERSGGAPQAGGPESGPGAPA